MALAKNRSDLWGNTKVLFGTHTFGSSYTADGESSDPGFGKIEHVAIDQPAGLVCEYDYTNKKILARRPGTPLIVEEVITVASNVGTLLSLPSYIVAVEVTAGSVTGAFDVIPTGETPLTKQVAVNFTTGVMTFLAGDAVTSVRVTYFAQVNGTLFAAAHFTVDETVVASASKVNLAARAATVQYVYDTTGGTMLTLIPPGEAPGSGECAVDIDDSGNTSIDTNADIDGNSLKVTYMKHAALPDPSVFIDDTDITLSSEAWSFIGDSHESGLHVPAFGTKLVGEATATNQVASWVGPSGTAANLVAVWTPAENKILTNQTTAMTTTAIPWLRLPNDGVELIEVPTGSDLSGVSARVVFHGQ